MEEHRKWNWKFALYDSLSTYDNILRWKMYNNNNINNSNRQTTWDTHNKWFTEILLGTIV